jgi:hypothetical protein
VDAHQRLRQAAVELAIPLHVRAEAGRQPVTMTSKAPPTVSPASLAASIARSSAAGVAIGTAQRVVVGDRRRFVERSRHAGLAA